MCNYGHYEITKECLKDSNLAMEKIQEEFIKHLESAIGEKEITLIGLNNMATAFCADLVEGDGAENELPRGVCTPVKDRLPVDDEQKPKK